MAGKMRLSMRTLLMCLCGSVLVAIALNCFLTPGGFAPGGISGIAVLIYRFSRGTVPVGLCIFLLNIPLFWAGYRKLGRQFILNSLLGTVLSAMAIDGLAFLTKYWTMPSGEPLLSCLGGGLLLGMGYGMVFRCGASTGGTDILARLIQRKMSNLSIGQLCLLFDGIFLVLVLVLYRSVVTVLYIGIAVFVSSKMVDAVEGGLNYAKEVFVVSEHSSEIGQTVIRELERGSTVLKGQGVYSGNSKDILWCVVYNRQLSQLREIVRRYDPQAFMAIRNVREVNGLYEGLAQMPENGLDIKGFVDGS